MNLNHESAEKDKTSNIFVFIKNKTKPIAWKYISVKLSMWKQRTTKIFRAIIYVRNIPALAQIDLFIMCQQHSHINKVEQVHSGTSWENCILGLLLLTCSFVYKQVPTNYIQNRT